MTASTGGMVASEAPLRGIRVLDFSWNLPGPYATWLLAGLGAEVVKIEPPRGDPARQLPAFFEKVNRGKHSVVVDRDDPEAAAIIAGWIRWADVLVEGFRPGKAAAVGADAARARALNPRLVYCSISAFGQEGPLRQVPGHDLNAQALSGALGNDRFGRPARPALPVADLSAGQLACQQILAALLARERTGEGATLDVAMTDAAAVWADLWGAGADLGAAAGGAVPARWRRLAGPLLRRLARDGLHALPHYDLFECADGAWIAIGIVDEDRFWRQLCADLGLRRFGGLPMGARAALGPLLRRAVARQVRRQPRAHWLAKWGAELPVSPVHRGPEARSAVPNDGRVFGPDRPFVGAAELSPAPALGGRAPRSYGEPRVARRAQEE